MKFIQIKNRFLQASLLLFLATIVSRGIAAAIAPILTRIYGPAQFGELAVFSSLLLGIHPLLTLRYPVAIPLPERDNEAANITALSIGLLSIVALLLFALLELVGVWFLSFWGAQGLWRWRHLILLGVAATSFYEILTLWATRRRLYNIVAKSQIVQSFSGELAKVALGMCGWGSLGLLIGHILSRGGGVVTFYFAFRKDVAMLWRSIKVKRMAALAVRYRTFPLFRLPSQLLLAVSQQLPVLSMSKLFNVSVAGQLGLAFLVVSVPTSIIGQNIGKVLHGEIARERDTQVIKEVFVTLTRRMILLSLAPAIVLYFFGEGLFVWIFGDEWRLAGRFSSLLSVYMVTLFVSIPAVSVFNVMKSQGVFLVLHVVRFLLVFLVFSGVYGAGDPDSVIQMYSLVMLIFFALMHQYCIFLLKKKGDV